MIRSRLVPVLLVVAAPLASYGCNKGSGEGGAGAAASASANTAAADAEAKTIFEQRCVACHGAQGWGNGVAAAQLNPKPRNYTDVNWQKSVTDDDLKKVIVKGGAAVGKSPLMPPNPDLESKPEVVAGLVRIVRSFSGKPGPAPQPSASASAMPSASASAAPSASASASAAPKASASAATKK